MSEGLTDIFTKPYEGAKEEGVLGALKGVGKGTVSLATKTTSGTLAKATAYLNGILISLFQSWIRIQQHERNPY